MTAEFESGKKKPVPEILKEINSELTQLDSLDVFGILELIDKYGGGWLDTKYEDNTEVLNLLVDSAESITRFHIKPNTVETQDITLEIEVNNEGANFTHNIIKIDKEKLKNIFIEATLREIAKEYLNLKKHNLIYYIYKSQVKLFLEHLLPGKAVCVDHKIQIPFALINPYFTADIQIVGKYMTILINTVDIGVEKLVAHISILDDQNVNIVEFFNSVGEINVDNYEEAIKCLRVLKALCNFYKDLKSTTKITNRIKELSFEDVDSELFFDDGRLRAYVGASWIERWKLSDTYQEIYIFVENFINMQLSQRQPPGLITQDMKKQLIDNLFHMSIGIFNDIISHKNGPDTFNTLISPNERDLHETMKHFDILGFAEIRTSLRQIGFAIKGTKSKFAAEFESKATRKTIEILASSFSNTLESIESLIRRINKTNLVDSINKINLFFEDLVTYHNSLKDIYEGVEDSLAGYDPKKIISGFKNRISKLPLYIEAISDSKRALTAVQEKLDLLQSFQIDETGQTE